jgi:hypothetical protein
MRHMARRLHLTAHLRQLRHKRPQRRLTNNQQLKTTPP